MNRSQGSTDADEEVPSHQNDAAREPLLGSSRQHDDNSTATAASVGTNATPDPRRYATVSICLVLIVLMELGEMLLRISLSQILEANICSNLHPPGQGGLPDNAHCKDRDVQAEFSMLGGVQATLDYVPGAFHEIFALL
jgi:hypothetical protein